jgi:hypothetical protein
MQAARLKVSRQQLQICDVTDFMRSVFASLL